MRKHHLVLTVALILFGFVGTAGATPTISIAPTGDYAMAVGDTVSFDVLFTADDDGDTLTGILLNLGYDATELSYVSYSTNATMVAAGWMEFFGTPENITQEGQSYLANYNFAKYFTSSGYEVAANESVSMGTFTFEATAGLVDDDLFDLWLVESVSPSEGTTYHSSITFNGGDGALDLLTAQGADVAPVPVPAAAWLLGSGLIGLLGLRRRKA